jgi:predicted nucleotidyltransferase
MLFKVREGDFVETFESLIFDVKGLIHPPNRIIAFLRYFPDEKGERKKSGKSYSKVYSLSKRYTLLEESYPQYVHYNPILDETVCEVSVDAVKKHYKPAEKLQELRSSSSLNKLEELALQLAQLLKEKANIPWNAIGISGSIMVGLHTSGSDVDPIVYGSQNCRKVHSALENLSSDKKGSFKPYTQKDLKDLFDFRSKDTMTNYEDFVRTESRKVLQGKFLQRDYFIRFVRDWSEVDGNYGDVHYVNVGYARVKATVVDDSESIFTPCVYKVSNARVLEGPQTESVEEIASFRGRFCEQARMGEVVIAQGKVEQVLDARRNREYFRLLLGNKPSDYMNITLA